MAVEYLTHSLALAFISWIVGIIVNALIKNTTYYNQELSHFNFIKSEQSNRMIGIDAFRWIVKNTFFKFFNPKLKLKTKVDLAGLQLLRAEMTSAEIGHLAGFVFVSIFAVIKFLDFEFWFGFTIMIVNILMNLYPSLLQQENKRRMDVVIKRLQILAERRKP